MDRVYKTIPGICIMLMLGLLLFTGCSRQAAQTITDTLSKAVSVSKQEVSSQGKAYFEFFDTVSYIYSFAGDSEEQFDRNCAVAVDVLDHYHRLFDIYHEYSGINNLCTVNKNAGGLPIEVDPDLIDFLLYAKELCNLTNGEMDITMGSVLSIWHKARNADVPYLPKQEELEEAAHHIGFDKLEIDVPACTIRLTDKAASLDVGALGKGYATEKAAQALIDAGLSSYVLNIGGNIRIIGTKPDGSKWVTGIRDPKDSNNLMAIRFEISDTSCVTSGTYERYFTVDGVKYPHIIDKDTLWPARYCESLTVVTKDSGLADALSTALFCMPYEESRKLVDRMQAVDCIWIFQDGTKIHTDGIKPI